MLKFSDAAGAILRVRSFVQGLQYTVTAQDHRDMTRDYTALAV
jgi:hypothetical protein